MPFSTVKSLMSPVEASKLSGRYETTVEVKGGGSKPVLRSLRHAPEELILQGSLTPAKMHTTSLDIDRLCDLFNSKAKVSKSAAKADVPSRQTTNKADDEAVVQLHATFEESKKSEIEKAALPSVNDRPRRMARKDVAKKTETMEPKKVAETVSLPRRSLRFSMN